MSNNFRIYPDPKSVAQAAADYLCKQIQACVDAKGQCHVVLPGGSTPAVCLRLLADKQLPWHSIHWYPGDERCYPVGHEERNDTMIRQKLFSQNTQAEKTFHPMPAELGPEEAAKHYSKLLDEVGQLDIVVLGMGEDGHTASLFPGNAALEDTRSAVAVYEAPKAPDERISISLDTLRNAGECIVIATGEGKREALTRIMQGESLPVGMIEPDVWFIDQTASP